jgi:hypothetical protein
MHILFSITTYIPEKDAFMMFPWMRNPSTSMWLHRGEFLRGRRAEACMKFRAGRRVLSSFMKWGGGGGAGTKQTTKIKKSKDIWRFKHDE